MGERMKRERADEVVIRSYRITTLPDRVSPLLKTESLRS